jgi:hypothetical protein
MDACRATKATLSDILSRRDNFEIEAHALRDVIAATDFQLSEGAKYLQPLFQALKSNATLSPEQQLEYQKLVRQAKTLIFKNESVYGPSAIQPIADEMREANIWKTEGGDGTSGSIEYYELGSIGGHDGYYRHPRPRRDMYDQSGGQDDK